MIFEYDPAKSLANKAKHGIDFEEAKALWCDDRRLEIDAISLTEPRSMLIASDDESRVWAAIYTVRDDAIRIISVRRARDAEVKLYESI